MHLYLRSQQTHLYEVSQNDDIFALKVKTIQLLLLLSNNKLNQTLSQIKTFQI